MEAMRAATFRRRAAPRPLAGGMLSDDVGQGALGRRLLDLLKGERVVLSQPQGRGRGSH